MYLATNIGCHVAPKVMEFTTKVGEFIAMSDVFDMRKHVSPSNFFLELDPVK